MEKLVTVAILLILLIIDGPRDVFVYISNILKFLPVISVENALCLNIVRLITTLDHIGLKWRHIVRILPTFKMRNRICVTDVRNDGIKCVTEKFVPRNCVTAGN